MMDRGMFFQEITFLPYPLGRECPAARAFISGSGKGEGPVHTMEGASHGNKK